MKLEINGKDYEIIITRKNIKNMYMRVKEDKRIYISANYLVPKSLIKSFLYNNVSYLMKMISKIEKLETKKQYFYYLGNRYDIIIINRYNNPYFDEDKVFIKDKKLLDNFLKRESEKIFKIRLDICFKLFCGRVPYPNLMVRKMKKKWGYCNKRERLVKLNSELIKYSLNEIDYVIIHELCHFLHFDHSKLFWNEVKKIKPDYKYAQKVLKEE